MIIFSYYFYKQHTYSVNTELTIYFVVCALYHHPNKIWNLNLSYHSIIYFDIQGLKRHKKSKMCLLHSLHYMIEFLSPFLLIKKKKKILNFPLSPLQKIQFSTLFCSALRILFISQKHKHLFISKIIIYYFEQIFKIQHSCQFSATFQNGMSTTPFFCILEVISFTTFLLFSFRKQLLTLTFLSPYL